MNQQKLLILTSNFYELIVPICLVNTYKTITEELISNLFYFFLLYLYPLKPSILYLLLQLSFFIVLISYLNNTHHLKDPIWLAVSISIFIFLLINTGMQIYALSSKTYCLILSCGLITLFVIVLSNCALIYYISYHLGYHIGYDISVSIDESMKTNQIT